ncbi:cobalamin B12-binding domain-containing protein [Pseudothermotoga thermarum]|uniref:Cobalamin B12-binding domain protein n=1 Tax=Pseudothermotoga thermarum DSM 5069 TaxID=688269 RepID=F7YTU8_9THEM|nr:cobalamin-dependent protein [Pseudothermotoga thermarum]AEH51393.1 cobalamin B12-binding domain protein [Pseudothermotoga thermarum DSM 5069]
MKIVLVPLDPVHDVAVKILRRIFSERGHDVVLLPPDMKLEEVVEICLKENPDYIMVSRTVGYNAAEILGRFIDLIDAAGLRKKCKVVVGGKAVTPQLAAELGYDAGFGEKTKWEEVIEFVEGRTVEKKEEIVKKKKFDITQGYSYKVKDSAFEELLEKITSQILNWAERRTSPGVERAKIRERIFEGEDLTQDYLKLSDDLVREFYKNNVLPKHVRLISQDEYERFKENLMKVKIEPKSLRHVGEKPLVFVQYGTGCPFMDAMHIKVSEAWGADGVLHFDPSWGARCEGFLSGLLAHEEDGSIITFENLKIIKSVLEESTLWCVRAHRGLNTPETVVLAAKAGADLTKINMVYGSLNGGTDPERLTVDGVYAIKLAARYGMPFDIPTNEELGGVPAHKAFAGMLVVAYLGVKLGAKPILKPLFCYSPDVMINKYMEDNYIDYNAGKVFALRDIIDAPIWPGEPIGFMTHTEDRVQSAMTTALHAALAKSLNLDAITIASTDEAYARGAITSSARIDTLRAVAEAFRFFGQASIEPTKQAFEDAEMIKQGIYDTLKKVAERGDFVASLYEGLFGTREEGANPGRNGRGTVRLC